tara:strand:+ start:394 stop:696 length:303 start_codon:yes stop_codon:yes gene_type:complete
MSRLGKLKRQAINEANKRVLNEQNIEDMEEVVMGCIMENTSLTDIASIPPSCIEMVMKQDPTKALECGMAMDYDDLQLILSKLEPISKCVLEKTSSPVMN